METASLEALTDHSGTATDGAKVCDVGTVYGFYLLALLLLGAVTVTGELFGLIRSSGRSAPCGQEA